MILLACVIALTLNRTQAIDMPITDLSETYSRTSWRPACGTTIDAIWSHANSAQYLQQYISNLQFIWPHLNAAKILQNGESLVLQLGIIIHFTEKHQRTQFDPTNIHSHWLLQFLSSLHRSLISDSTIIGSMSSIRAWVSAGVCDSIPVVTLTHPLIGLT